MRNLEIRITDLEARLESIQKDVDEVKVEKILKQFEAARVEVASEQIEKAEVRLTKVETVITDLEGDSSKKAVKEKKEKEHKSVNVKGDKTALLKDIKSKAAKDKVGRISCRLDPSTVEKNREALKELSKAGELYLVNYVDGSADVCIAE